MKSLFKCLLETYLLGANREGKPLSLTILLKNGTCIEGDLVGLAIEAKEIMATAEDPEFHEFSKRYIANIEAQVKDLEERIAGSEYDVMMIKNAEITLSHGARMTRARIFINTAEIAVFTPQWKELPRPNEE